MPLRQSGLARLATGAAVLTAMLVFGHAVWARELPDEAIATAQAGFRIVQLADGLEHPWGLAFLPGGDILVTERSGRLRLVQDGRLRPEPVAGTPEVWVHGQAGLLDIALDPAFATNQLIYLSYTAAKDDGATIRVMRARHTSSGLNSQKVIFEALASGSGENYGSRLVFGPDGMLYVTVGERGDRAGAQNLTTHGGSILRLRPDGSVPDDNPFVGRGDARPEIYSYGHRNPQGLAVQPGTGVLFAHEHGPQGGDEVNLIRAGANYGWPVISYGENYGGGRIGEGTHKPGMEQPVWYWVPSIAPSGMTFYDADAFPEWRGDLFVGALQAELIARLELEHGKVVEEERFLEGVLGRIRDVRTGPDGLLYILTDDSDGALYRLEPED
jgi:glucose/arabinose dehydrogenase